MTPRRRHERGCPYLFVYGSLRSTSGHPMARWLARNARRIGPAWFQGRKFRVSWYPGAVDSEDPRDRVEGELWRLKRPRTALARLDRYEGFDPAHPERSEFVRVVRPIRCGRRRLQAWIYLYVN